MLTCVAAAPHTALKDVSAWGRTEDEKGRVKNIRRHFMRSLTFYIFLMPRFIDDATTVVSVWSVSMTRGSMHARVVDKITLRLIG